MDEIKMMGCNYCKINRPIKYFSKNRKDEYNKSCDECRAKQKVTREKYKGKYKCEHNRRKSFCKECGGSFICEHNRQKFSCKECGGRSICKHNRQKSHCKECNDPIDLTIKRWIMHSKKEDIKKNRYDDECKNNFIDYDYCMELVNFYKHCYHCRVPLQYIHYQDDLATIERLDNKIGHMKLNCVLACKTCNCKRVSDKLSN